MNEVYEKALNRTFDPNFKVKQLPLEYWPDYKWIPLARIQQQKEDNHD